MCETMSYLAIACYMKPVLCPIIELWELGVPGYYITHHPDGSITERYIYE